MACNRLCSQQRAVVSLHRALPHAAGARRSVQCHASASHVVVTREQGKNGKLIQALSKHGLSCVELPLIEHAAGPDRDKLSAELSSNNADWVAITSPEAAAVFVEAWTAAGKPQVRVAAVGGGTADALHAAGVTAAFTPTKATGKVMGAELPHIDGGSQEVLYPASVRASSDLENALAQSGFTVRRFNTYDTVPVSQVEPAALQAALAAPIITFGSPSAVKAWLKLVGLEEAQRHFNACIGSTSARACEAAGLTANVLYPDSPGIEGWVEVVLQAAQQLQLVGDAADVRAA